MQNPSMMSTRGLSARVVSACGVGLVALVLSILAMPAEAASAHDSQRGVSERSASPLPRLKDCTRFNGRWGYYGNPWCTAAEQDRFDRREAVRAGRPRRSR